MGFRNNEEKKELIGGPQVVNPFVTYDSLDEAEKAAGFELILPERIEGYDEPLVQLMSGKMIQVIYGDREIYIRKMASDDDISGDYNVYKVNEVSDLTGVDVIYKGDGEKIYNVTWHKEGYAYSVYSSKGMSVEMAFWLAAMVK